MIKFNKEIVLFFVYTLAFFFLCSIFSPLYNSFNYWCDINIYNIIGKSIWHEKVIYKDLFDHKGPLIFFIYSLGYPFSQNSFFGIFFVQVCFQTIALYFGYLSLKLFIDKKLAILLSLFLPVLLIGFTHEGGSPEEFIYVFELISLYYFLRFFKDGQKEHPPVYMFIHGAMLTLCFFIKLSLIVFWFFPLLAVFISLLCNRSFKNLFANILYFLSGILLVAIPILSYFMYHGALSDFWEVYIGFNALYGSFTITNYVDFVLGVVARFYHQFMVQYIVYGLMIVSILFFMFSSILKNRLGGGAFALSLIALVFVVTSNAAVLTYYYISTLVFNVLGLILIGLVISRFYSPKYIKVAIAFTVVIGLAIGCFQKKFFNFDIETLSSRNFPKTEVEIFGEEIAKAKNPTLLVTGIKMGLPIFTHLNLTPSVRYFFSPNILHEKYPTLREQQTYYIENSMIDYVVVDDYFRYADYYKDILSDNYRIILDYKDPSGKKAYLYKKKD